MDFVSKMKAKAVSRQKDLVLPEGTVPRIIKAARIIKKTRRSPRRLPFWARSRKYRK